MVTDNDEASGAVRDPAVELDSPVAEDDPGAEAETPDAEDGVPTTEEGESTLPEDTPPIAVEVGAWTCPSEICVKT